MKKAIPAMIAVFMLLFACSSNKYAATNKVYKKQAKAYGREISKYPVEGNKQTWVGTTNFGLRKPSYVIIHNTAQNSCDQTLKTFTLPRTQVSAHYVICKDGTVHHMLNDYLRAWHAGVGSWGNDKDINSSSIGIELDNNGVEAFSEPQLKSLLTVLDTLKKKYNIPSANFIGHGDIAPGRKVDPNPTFPWQTLAQRKFGLWYSDTSTVNVPDNFNAIQALRIVGYSIKDTTAAIGAFKQHFALTDSAKVLTVSDRKVLYNLMLQYQ